MTFLVELPKTNTYLVALPAKHVHIIRTQLQARLHYLEDDLQFYKEMIGTYWKRSDKDNPNTATYFANLNHCKNRARKVRKELKLIRETLKALK